MARSFSEVVDKITDIMPELKDDLEQSMDFWEPEARWSMLNLYVHDHVEKDSSNPRSIAVYAALCRRTKEHIKADFIARGY